MGAKQIPGKSTVPLELPLKWHERDEDLDSFRS